MKKIGYVCLILIFSGNCLFSEAQQPQTRKEALLLLISEGFRLHGEAQEGSENGEYQPGSKAVFGSALKIAQSLSENASATAAQLEEATYALFQAYQTFQKHKMGISNPYSPDNYELKAITPALWAHYNTHDPSIIYADGYWYSFSTDAAWGYTSKGIPVKRSRDLVYWEHRGWAFNAYPAEAQTWLNEQSLGIMNGIWAPYILRVGTEYRLYYCAVTASGSAAIILAASDNIEGPWTQRGIVQSTVQNSVFNAIDPTVSIDKEGRHWMIYGSWHQGIAYIELDQASGLKKAGSDPVRISRNRYAASGWTNSMEAPEIIYNPNLDKYFLFLAQGDLETVYHTRVARADHPAGPWYDYSGNVIDYTTKKDIYPLIEYPYRFNNHPGWVGIAHSTVVCDGADFFIINQARPAALSTMMVMHVRKLYWTEDGWPAASPERYTNPGIMPEITSGDIPGAWEIIGLDELKYGGISVDVPGANMLPVGYMNTSSETLFYADGTTNRNGTWSFSNNMLTVTQNRKTDKYFVDWEWDWENQCATLVFTGIQSTGRSAWGKKIQTPPAAKLDNIIINGTFDDDLKHWKKTSYGGSYTVDVAPSGINGKSFHVACSAPANNYWDQQISWMFPASKASRYKLSFKAKASAENVGINIEIQNQNNIPVFRTAAAGAAGSLTLGQTEKIYEFITHDVSVADGLYVMNIQYGNMTAGTEIWIDDISLEDISVGWYNNYITNGWFGDRFNAWTRTVPRNGYIDLDSSVLMDGNPSVKLSLANQMTSWTAAGLSWNVHLYAKFRYYFDFDAISETGMQVKLILKKNNVEISDIAPLDIPAGNSKQTYSLLTPEITEEAVYTVSLNYGLANAGSEAWINHLRLIPEDKHFITMNKEITALPKANVQVYPNPFTSYIRFYPEIIQSVTVFGVNGTLYKSNVPVLPDGYVNLSDLPAGTYIVKLTGNYIESQQILVKR